MAAPIGRTREREANCYFEYFAGQKAQPAPHEQLPSADVHLVCLIMAIAVTLAGLFVCSIADALQGSILAGMMLAGFAGLALWILDEIRHPG